MPYIAALSLLKLIIRYVCDSDSECRVQSVVESSKIGPSGHLGLKGLQVIITPLPIYSLKVVGPKRSSIVFTV